MATLDEMKRTAQSLQALGTPAAEIEEILRGMADPEPATHGAPFEREKWPTEGFNPVVPVTEAPPVRVEAPKYPSVSQPGNSTNMAGIRVDEQLRDRAARQDHPYPAGDIDLEQALHSAQSAAEIIEIMRQSSGQTGLDVKGRGDIA